MSEKIASHTYWQMVQLSLIYFSTYFIIDNAQGIIRTQNDWIWLGDVIFIPIVLHCLWEIWKARQKIKRFTAARSIIAEFGLGHSNNFEAVEAAVQQALPNVIFSMREIHEDEE